MKPQLRPARPEDETNVRQLLKDSGLQPQFNVDEFLVATTDDGTIIACGRLRPLGDGTYEIASVAVAKAHRGTGLGATIMEAVLDRADGPVYGLSLIPEFLLPFGFTAIDHIPPTLKERADSDCCCYEFTPMILGRAPQPPA